MAKAKAKKQDEGLTCFSPAGTVCFPHVWEPYAFKGQGGKQNDPNYSLILVFDEEADLTEMKQAAGRAIVKKWGSKGKELLKRQKLTLPWRDADDYSKYGEPFVEGNTMINFKSKGAPGVVNARAKPILNQMDFYAGCKARVSCYAHAYDTMGNMGVTFLLNNIQKVADGERISGKMPAEEEFDAVESEEDEELEDIL